MILYFLQAGDKGPIKIGVTDDVNARLKNLQTGNPYKLNLLHKIEIDYTLGEHREISCEEMEKYFHTNFRADRMEGEWYAPTDYLYQCIETLKQGKDIEGFFWWENEERSKCWKVIEEPLNKLREISDDLLKKGNLAAVKYIAEEVESLGHELIATVRKRHY